MEVHEEKDKVVAKLLTARNRNSCKGCKHHSGIEKPPKGQQKV